MARYVPGVYRPKSALAARFAEYLEGKDVVLVGPAASLSGRGLGPSIDAFDVVARLNLSSPVPEALQGDIGSRTDVLYHVLFDQHLAHAARQQHSETQVEEWRRDGVQYLVTRQEPGHERILQFERITKGAMPLLTMDRGFKASIRKQTGTNPNTGTIAITHLLSLPIRSLHVTGFDFYATGYYVGYGGFDEEQAARGKGGYGRWGQDSQVRVPHRQDGQMRYLADLHARDGRLTFDDVAMERLGLTPREPSIVAVVPIKANSERVPGKNMRELCGQPLLYWALKTLHEARHVSRVVVDTDSEEIRDEVLRRWPRTTVLMRPEELHGGHITGNDLIAWELTQVEGEHFGQFHVTSPLLTPDTVDRAIVEYFEHQTPKGRTNAAKAEVCDSLFAVIEQHFWLYDKDGKAVNSDPAKLIRSQDLEPLYEDSHAIHLFSRASFEKTGSRIGERPRLFTIGKVEATDIDWEEDFVIAEALMSWRLAHA